jgi:transcriptional regulator with XRE-family HTH domain
MYGLPGMVKGEKIRDWRKAKGLSREKVAVAINKSLSTVINLEQGKRAETETLLQLARLMDCHIEDLLDVPENSLRAS